jgi:chromosome partitioning protein
MILALVNNKGGVGKTTTAVNLSAALVGKDRQVLLIDLDSQGSASLSLGVSRTDLHPSSADVLLDGVAIRNALRSTLVDGLDLLTGSMELANADLFLSEVSGREGQLKMALHPIQQDYDFIILDCPPSLSLLSINALVAVDAFIVPVSPQYLALEGLVNLLEAVGRIHQEVGTVGGLLGLLLTLVDYRTKVTSEIVQMIRGHYKDQVFKTEVGTSVRLAEAPSFGKSIFNYAASSRGALAYQSLAEEVIVRCRTYRKEGERANDAREKARD